MTDTSKEAVERLIADCKLAAKTLSGTKTFQTGQSIYLESATMLSALSAQLKMVLDREAANFSRSDAREIELEAKLAAANAQAAAALEAADRARDAALEEAVDRLGMEEGTIISRRVIHAIASLRTKPCDTKPAENVTKTDLCKGNVPHNAGQTITVTQISKMPVKDIDWGEITITENWGRLFISEGKAEIIVHRPHYDKFIAGIQHFTTAPTPHAAMEFPPTQSCDTKPAENATQAGLCNTDAAQDMTVQEAARLLLDDDVTLSKMAEAIHDGPFGADDKWFSASTRAGGRCLGYVRAALRAIAGGGQP